MHKFSALTMALALAACTTPSTPFDPGVAGQFVGKTLTTVDGSTTFLFLPDGVVGGNTSSGDPIVGTYAPDGEKVCSSYSAPEQLAGLGTICSTPVVDGDTVVFNRTDGSQSPVYEISG